MYKMNVSFGGELQRPFSHGHSGRWTLNFGRNPIVGLVRARREDVRKNSSRFVHVPPEIASKAPHVLLLTATPVDSAQRACVSRGT